ncbi:MAG: sulfite exporter TauE/SafE family protein [Sphingobacteriales bacterium]|nr:sulfite exporter TauE/SafE family protein [Sphingobacteriales bacterium]
MEQVVVCFAAFATALMTFFTGFGLGTILSPVLMLFFPPPLAIALTGVVHFLNNLYKLILTGRHARKEIVTGFGIPAVIAALVGAWLLIRMGDAGTLYSYNWDGRVREVSLLSFLLGILMLTFTVIDLAPLPKRFGESPQHLLIGGLLSGFFGGLSGHQGALRSAFLVRTGLSKEQFIGSAVLVSACVDLTRLSIYYSGMKQSLSQEHIPLLVGASLSAFAGATIGNKLLQKVTLKFVQASVTLLLGVIGLALLTGIL